jgi:hypothetical protein
MIFAVIYEAFYRDFNEDGMIVLCKTIDLCRLDHRFDFMMDGIIGFGERDIWCKESHPECSEEFFRSKLQSMNIV